MTVTSGAIQTSQPLSVAVDDDDMFAGLPALDRFELKRIELATQLVALMTHCNETRSSLAECLDWKKSRITQVFSGRGNPTIRTIYDITNVLGYDFDVIFRKPEEQRATQPWEQRWEPVHEISVASRRSDYKIVIQTAGQIANDLRQGKASPLYVTLNQTDSNHRHSLTDSAKALQYQTIDDSFPTVSANSHFEYIEP